MPDNSPPRRALSITLRLVGGYTLVALVTLSAASLLLYRGLRQKFFQEHTQSMADRVTSLRRGILDRNGRGLHGRQRGQGRARNPG